MAHKDIEVETKIPVSKKTFEKIARKLPKIAKKVTTLQQVDTYYNAPHKDYFKLKLPLEYLRLRKDEKGISFDYKKWYTRGDRKNTCDEYEVGLDSYPQMEKMLSVLGFKKVVTIDKTRRIFKYEEISKLKRSFEIALDKVKGLGYFVEIEALRNRESLAETLNILHDFAKELGLDPSKEDRTGYVLLYLRKKGLIK